MKNWSAVLFALITSLIFAVGCSTSGSSPITPLDPVDLTSGNEVRDATASNTHLWGYYDVHIDPETLVVSANLSRSAMFTANCVNFLNSMTGSIGFNIYNIDETPTYIDVDLIVSLTHPFPGLPQYHGYDVRGVFMGDASESMAYNPALNYPVFDVDQGFQRDPSDPQGADGHPDGYSRWFNMAEFTGPGLPLFTYTQGVFATPGYTGTATLSPFKYFADSLGENESLPAWLQSNPDLHGVFSSGAVNHRDYKLRFSADGPLNFSYAVLANWNGPEPENHPSNAPEAVGCIAVQGGTVYYIDDTNWGGTVDLDLTIYDWGEYQVSGAMEEYNIYIESTALTSVYQLTPDEMTPTEQGENYLKYFADFDADALESAEGNEFWVIVENPNFDYTNEFGVLNDAWEDPVTAFFRFDLQVGAIIPTQVPVCDLLIEPCSLHYWDITDHVAVTFDASGSYDPDGDPFTYHWDFDGDEIYDEAGDDDYTGDPWNPTHDYYEDGTCNLKVVDVHGAFSVCTVDVDIVEEPSKNIPLRESPWVARDFAVDPSNGELHILYYWNNTANNTHWIETWIYSPCDLYEEPQSAHHTAPQGARYYRIDVSPMHYSVIGGPVTGASGKVRNIDPDGNDLGPNWIINCTEVWCFNAGGNWEYDHCTIYPFPNPPWNPTGHSTFLYRAPYSTFSTWEQSAQIYWSQLGLGYNRVYAGHIRGTDPDASGDTFWVLTDPGNPATTDYYGARWQLIASPGGLSGLSYNNAYFGTGSRTDADTCWYNARDMTRNSDDVLLVLDELSDGTGRVKGFNGDATGGTSLGGFDIPDSVNGTPLRIDSSDYLDPVYGNLVYVLHGDASDGYLMSIYFEDELPW